MIHTKVVSNKKSLKESNTPRLMTIDEYVANWNSELRDDDTDGFVTKEFLRWANDNYNKEDLYGKLHDDWWFSGIYDEFVDETNPWDNSSYLYGKEDGDLYGLSKAGFHESKKLNKNKMKEHTISDLDDFTKEMIEDAAEDDYSMNRKDSAASLIEWLYKDEDISPELARKAYDYYCNVYSELGSHSESNDCFDDEWEETDDPLYGYGEDDLVESKKQNKKSIKEASGTLAGNNYKDKYVDQSNDVGYEYRYEREQKWINSYPYNAFDYPEQFVGNLNKFLPDGVFAKLGSKIEATPYSGPGFNVEIEDTQSSDELNKTFEISFTYEDIFGEGEDEIQVAAIFKPYRDANVIQTWITRNETWEEFGEDLVSKIWGK